MSVSITSTLVSEYVVDRIVEHEDYDQNRKYVVRWFWYEPKHDMLEPV